MIVAILRRRKLRTVTNFFLANLAVADLFVGIVCVVPHLVLILENKWLFGAVRKNKSNKSNKYR